MKICWVLNMKKGAISSGLFALIVTVTVIGILIFSGPAQAFTTGFLVLNNQVNKGEIVNLKITVDIGQNEYLDIDNLVVNFEGPEQIYCQFDSDGNKIAGCDGISIIKTRSADYEFGYGFNDGVMEYEISFDSDKFSAGQYTTKFYVFSGSNIITERTGENFLVKSDIGSLAGCSVRGKGGSLIAETLDIGDNNKLSLNIPLTNAVGGSGSIIGQQDRTRFRYGFEIIEVLENNPTYFTLKVKGEYRVGLEVNKEKIAVLRVDKLTKKASLDCDIFSLIDMDVTFMERC